MIDGPVTAELSPTQAVHWITQMASDWKGEIPTRIHDQGHGQHWGLGSAPPFAPEFIGYIGRLSCKDPNCGMCRRQEKRPVAFTDGEGYRNPSSERLRTTRAFRKLRRVAPLEFDVLYLAVMHGHTISEITAKLNERAITKGYPERYDDTSTGVLLLCGIDKAARWF